MGIKIKHRDPKTTDFKKNEVVINITDGSLFYKSSKGLHKVATTATVGSAVVNIEEIDIDELIDSFPSITTEEIQAIVGAMFSDNIETNINATYDSTAQVINLEVPTQEVNEDGEVVSGNFYEVGLDANNGAINAVGNRLFLGANHESTTGIVETDKSSIVLNQDQPTTDVNGDLHIQSNTADTTDGIGAGTLTRDANVTAGGNIRGNKIVFTNEDGDEYYLGVNDWGLILAIACTNADPCN